MEKRNSERKRGRSAVAFLTERDREKIRNHKLISQDKSRIWKKFDRGIDSLKEDIEIMKNSDYFHGWFLAKCVETESIRELLKNAYIPIPEDADKLRRALKRWKYRNGKVWIEELTSSQRQRVRPKDCFDPLYPIKNLRSDVQKRMKLALLKDKSIFEKMIPGTSYDIDEIAPKPKRIEKVLPAFEIEDLDYRLDFEDKIAVVSKKGRKD